jgi:hypothetical protein
MSHLHVPARTLARALCATLAASALACATPPQPPAPPAEPVATPVAVEPAAATAPAEPVAPTAPARPPLRRLFAAHPKTIVRQTPPDNDARIESHLAAHPDTPADIARAIRAHEIWLGMTEAEVVLSVGPATRKEPVREQPGAYGLFYAGEGWFLSFDSGGYLYQLVER